MIFFNRNKSSEPKEKPQQKKEAMKARVQTAEGWRRQLSKKSKERK